MDTLSSSVFEQYQQVHGDFLDAQADPTEWQAQYDTYGELNYAPHLPAPDTNPAILEIGSYLGQQIRWLKNKGYQNLTGIELDPRACEAARRYTEIDSFFAEEATAFLSTRPAAFDVIIAKAVLEHVGRSETTPFLSSIARSLHPGGVTLITVPNMDWLLAGHERYLDPTHRMGYTRESLGTVLRLFFHDVHVTPFRTSRPTGVYGAYARMVRRLAVALIRKAYLYIGEGLHECWFEHRAIMGVARSPVFKMKDSA